MAHDPFRAQRQDLAYVIELLQSTAGCLDHSRFMQDASEHQQRLLAQAGAHVESARKLTRFALNYLCEAHDKSQTGKERILK